MKKEEGKGKGMQEDAMEEGGGGRGRGKLDRCHHVTYFHLQRCVPWKHAIDSF